MDSDPQGPIAVLLCLTITWFVMALWKQNNRGIKNNMRMLEVRNHAVCDYGPSQRHLAMKRDLPVRHLFKQMLKINIETDSALHDVKRNEAIFRRRYSHLISRVEPLGKGSKYQNQELYSRAERQVTLRRKSEPCPKLPPFNVDDTKIRHRASSLYSIGSAAGRDNALIATDFGRRTSYLSCTSTKPSRIRMVKRNESDQTSLHSDGNLEDTPNLGEEQVLQELMNCTKTNQNIVAKNAREINRETMFIDFGPTIMDKMFNALFDSESETENRDEIQAENSSAEGDSLTENSDAQYIEAPLQINEIAKTEPNSLIHVRRRVISRKKGVQHDNSVEALQKCRYLRVPNNPNEQIVKIWRI